MRRIYIVLLLSFLAFSCVDKVIDAPKEEKIPIGFASPRAKSLVTTENICTDGNQIHVYDVVTGFNPSPGLYMSEYIDYSSATGKWHYGTGNEHFWTTTGKHKFFAWSKKMGGADITDLIGNNYDISEPLAEWVQIRNFTFTSDSPQFDFVYSDIVDRDMDVAAPDHSPVPLTFHHLFTGLALEIRNDIETPVTINSVTLTGIQNRNGCVMRFGTESSVQYYNGTVDGNFLTRNVSGVIPAKSLSNVYALNAFTGMIGTDPSSDPMLVWPQNGADITVVVNYTYLGDTYERTAVLSDASMLPGQKYRLLVIISDDVLVPLELTLNVLPWDYTSVTTNLRVVGTGLFFDPDDYEVDGSDVVIRGDQTLTGTFKVEEPSDGMWYVTVRGDADWFNISPISGMIDGGEVTLSISPVAGLDRSENHNIYLQFGVISPNMDMNATEILNPVDYLITLPYKVE